jgi:ribonuclease HI
LLMKKVIIFTDGACSGNPGKGGWGAVLQYGGHEKEVSGYEPETTNNRMELRAAIESLKVLKQPCDVDLYTDSVYVKDGITTWINTWMLNNWKNANKKPVKNADLWQELLDITGKHLVKWHWVKGHDGNELNERADQLARDAIKDNNPSV